MAGLESHLETHVFIVSSRAHGYSSLLI